MSEQFETKLQSLEKIVKELESGELSLEDALKSFENGIKISRECHVILKNAEQKIEVLVKNGNEVVGKENYE